LPVASANCLPISWDSHPGLPESRVATHRHGLPCSSRFLLDYRRAISQMQEKASENPRASRVLPAHSLPEPEAHPALQYSFRRCSDPPATCLRQSFHRLEAAAPAREKIAPCCRKRGRRSILSSTGTIRAWRRLSRRRQGSRPSSARARLPDPGADARVKERSRDLQPCLTMPLGTGRGTRSPAATGVFAIGNNQSASALLAAAVFIGSTRGSDIYRLQRTYHE